MPTSQYQILNNSMGDGSVSSAALLGPELLMLFASENYLMLDGALSLVIESLKRKNGHVVQSMVMRGDKSQTAVSSVRFSGVR